MGHGFDEDDFQSLCDALVICAEAWRSAEHIPKAGAGALVELILVLEPVVDMYKGEEAKRIRAGTSTLVDLVLKCIAV